MSLISFDVIDPSDGKVVQVGTIDADAIDQAIADMERRGLVLRQATPESIWATRASWEAQRHEREDPA